MSGNFAVGISDDDNGASIIIKENYLDGMNDGIIFNFGAHDTIASNIINTTTGITIGDSPSSYSYIFNNTIVAGTFGGNIQGVNWQNNAKILNNIMVNRSGGPIYNFDNTLDSGTIIDYNDYQLSGPYNLSFYSSNYQSVYSDFAQWQAATGNDKHSMIVNPDFINDTTNLRATNDSIKGAGIFISGITTDIDGNARPNPPSIGANEIVKTGIQTISNKNTTVTIYPNPATNTLYIESAINIIRSVSVFDITGKEIYKEESLKSQNQSISVGNLPSGIYIIKLRFDNGEYVAKFMKE